MYFCPKIVRHIWPSRVGISYVFFNFLFSPFSPFLKHNQINYLGSCQQLRPIGEGVEMGVKYFRKLSGLNNFKVHKLFCQQVECPHSTLPLFASGGLDFRFLDYFRLVARCIAHTCAWRTYIMTWAHIIWPKWQRGVGTLELLAVWWGA